MKQLYDEKTLIYNNQTSLEHVLKKKLNAVYFTCDK